MNEVLRLVINDLKTSLEFAIMCGPVHEMEKRIDDVFSKFELRLLNAIDDECVHRAAEYVKSFKDLTPNL